MSSNTLLESDLYRQFAAAYYAVAGAEKYFKPRRKHRRTPGMPQPIAATRPLARTVQHPWDVRAQRSFGVVRGAAPGRFFDTTKPDEKSPPLTPIVKTAPPQSVLRAHMRARQSRAVKPGTVGYTHAFVKHLADDVAHDSIQPRPHRLADGTVIHRFDQSDVAKHTMVKHQVMEDLLRRMGYRGIVTHDQQGKPLYRPFDDENQPAAGNLTKFMRAYYGAVERYAYRNPDTGEPEDVQPIGQEEEEKPPVPAPRPRGRPRRQSQPPAAPLEPEPEEQEPVPGVIKPSMPVRVPRQMPYYTYTGTNPTAALNHVDEFSLPKLLHPNATRHYPPEVRAQIREKLSRPPEHDEYGISRAIGGVLKKMMIPYEERVKLIPDILYRLKTGYGTRTGRNLYNWDPSTAEPGSNFNSYLIGLVRQTTQNAARAVVARPSQAKGVIQDPTGTTTKEGELIPSGTATASEDEDVGKMIRDLVGKTYEEQQAEKPVRERDYIVPFKTRTTYQGDRWDRGFVPWLYGKSFVQQLAAEIEQMPRTNRRYGALRRYLTDIGKQANWVYAMRRAGFSAVKMAGDPSVRGFAERLKVIYWLQARVRAMVQRYADQHNIPEFYRRYNAEAISRSQIGAQKMSREPWLTYPDDFHGIARYIDDQIQHGALPPYAKDVLEALASGKSTYGAIGKQGGRAWTTRDRVKAMIPEYYETTGQPEKAQEFRDKLLADRVASQKKAGRPTSEIPQWPAEMPKSDAEKLSLITEHLGVLYPHLKDVFAKLLPEMWKVRTQKQIAAELGKGVTTTQKLIDLVHVYVRAHAQKIGDQQFVDRLIAPRPKGNPGRNAMELIRKLRGG